MISCVFATYYYEVRLKKQISDVSDLIKFIHHIRSEIEFFQSPVSRIFEKYDKTELTNAIISRDYSRFDFNESIEEAVSSFFTSLGHGLKRDELAFCDQTISILERELAVIKSSYPTSVKIHRSLSLFFGALVVILIV